MEDLKKYLLKNKIFNKTELKTLQYSKINNCNMCNKKCGELVKLTECNLKTIICYECMDNLHDNYNLNTTNKELFKCLCCNNKIYNYINFV